MLDGGSIIDVRLLRGFAGRFRGGDERRQLNKVDRDVQIDQQGQARHRDLICGSGRKTRLYQYLFKFLN